jgi:hypothetical protein
MCDNSTFETDLAAASGLFDKDLNLSGAQSAHYLHELHIVSYNAQRSWSNVTALLETHKSADVILIQEMPWANYKRIASATDKAGDIVMGTVRHTSFVCIEDSKTSSVCFNVNRQLAHLSPVIEDVAGLDKDNTLVLCLTLMKEKRQVRLMNIYNHPKDMSAVKALIDNEDMLPAIELCMGDFNMHHPLWNTPESNTRPSALAQDLVAVLQGYLNLCLINRGSNGYTWSSNNAVVKDQVLNLTWTEQSTAPEVSLDVDMLGRFNSDHTVLLLTLPCGEIQIPQRPTIKRGLKTGALYVADLRKLLLALPLMYTSYNHVQDICNDLYCDFDCIWHKHATFPRPSRHSSSWWNNKCSDMCKRLSQMCSALRDKKKTRRYLLSKPTGHNHTDCVQHLTSEIVDIQSMAMTLSGSLKACIKRAKRQFYDSQLERLAENKLWDMVDWTRPCKTTTSVALFDPTTGQTTSDPTQVAELLSD